MPSSILFFVSASVFVATNTFQTVAASAESLATCSYTQNDSKFSQFHALSAIPNSQPDGYFAKVNVSVTSDNGDVHILLAESDDFENSNRGYEFVSTLHNGGEIRRRSSVYGQYEVLARTNASTDDRAPLITTFELSVSIDGVVKVSVLSPNSTIASYDPSFLFVDFKKFRNPISNYTLESTDAHPIPINFIAFSGHTRFQYNCNYGIFREEKLFIQTKCEALLGWTPENLFHTLQINDKFQPDGYHANVNIAMLSDYRNLHVILSETNEKTEPNPSYEIVIADRFSTESEFRRKSSFGEMSDFVNRFPFTYNIDDVYSSLWMRISVTTDGVLSFTDLRKNITFNFIDTAKAIPVKYITFGGYQNIPANYEIDCLIA